MEFWHRCNVKPKLKMNHTKEKLDECVFDFLTSHSNRYYSAWQIYDSIRGKSGHRCESLTTSRSDRMYLMCVCYGLNNRYRNIKKRVTRRTVYLAFETTKVDEQFNDLEVWSDFSFADTIDYMCENSLYTNYDNDYYEMNYDGDEPLIHVMVRRGSYEALKNLVKGKMINMDCKNDADQTPLDVAFECGDRRKITLLMNHAAMPTSSTCEKCCASSAPSTARSSNLVRSTMAERALTNEMVKVKALSSERRRTMSQRDMYMKVIGLAIYTIFILWFHSLITSMF